MRLAALERFFRAVRGQFLVELEARGGARDLAQLNTYMCSPAGASPLAICHVYL